LTRKPAKKRGAFKLSDLNIVDYVESKGYKVKAIGNVYRMYCPYPDHHETKPSFTLYPKTNSFMCFGCRRGGSILKLMKLFGDPIPPHLIEAEKTRRKDEHYKINVVQRGRLQKLQSLIVRIRNARKHYRNHAILNKRVKKLVILAKEFTF